MLRQSDDITDILEVCLGRVRAGESLEDCLRDYPGQAQELAPLLTAMLQVRALPQPVLSPRAREAIRGQLRRAVVQQRTAEQRANRARSLPRLALRFAVVVLVLIIVGLGGGVAAAQTSLPGSPLYRLKRVSEQARLGLATSAEQRAALHLDFAGARAVEILALTQSQRPVDGGVVADLAREYNLAWVEIERSRGAAGAVLRQRFVASNRADVTLFSATLAKVPGADRAMLTEAVHAGEQALERANIAPAPTALPTAAPSPEAPPRSTGVPKPQAPVAPVPRATPADPDVAAGNGRDDITATPADPHAPEGSGRDEAGGNAGDRGNSEHPGGPGTKPDARPTPAASEHEPDNADAPASGPSAPKRPDHPDRDRDPTTP